MSRIGKGGLIDKNKTKPLLMGLQPVQAISLNGLMQGPAIAVERQVGPGPGEVGL